MFDGTESPPGYGLLQTTPSQKKDNDFIVTIKEKSYLSSIAVKKCVCSGCHRLQINVPCASWRHELFAIDIAFSIASPAR